MLADGVDGELITWNATGVAATVAVGTAAQVLTSNGIGAAPTFQTAPTGATNLSIGTTTGTTLDVNSDTGTNATIPQAVAAGNAGLLSGSDKTKLDGAAVTSGTLAQFAATTSAQLAGVLSDETGTGAAVFGTSPTLVTPALGTPTALVGTNITGTATSFTSSNVTTNANLTGDVTSVGNASTVTEAGVTQHVGAINHNALLNYAIAQHRIINDAGSTTTELLSASKILALISAVSNNIDTKEAVATSTEGLGNITLSGEQTLNGVLTSTSRILVVEQTLSENNGIYVTAAGSWARSSDADVSAEVTNGMTTRVLNASSTKYRFSYTLITSDPITLGTTPLVFDAIPSLSFGTTAGTSAEGNDARIPTQDENNALVGTDGAPSTSNKYVTDSDSRVANSAVTTGTLAQFAATTSAQLAGVLSDETGSGAAVFATSPSLVTPVLGTPTSGTLTNCTGLPVSSGVSGLGTGVATFLATPSSANLASAVTDETGTGALVFGTSPTIANGTYTNSLTTSVRVVTAAGAVTVVANDYVIVVNKTVGASTALTLQAGVSGRTLIIKDGKGDAATNNITISPAAGNIDGAATFVMNVNYGAIKIVYNGTEWNIV